MLEYVTYSGVDASKYIPWDLLHSRSDDLDIPHDIFSILFSPPFLSVSLSLSLFLCLPLSPLSNKKSEKRKFNESDIFQQLEQQETSGGATRLSTANEDGEKEDSEVRDAPPVSLSSLTYG
jgi:hypothetical protein